MFTPSNKPANFYLYLTDHFKNDLISTLENVELLTKIANNSTIHSNGFLKIVLNSFNGYKLRLHIWDFKDTLQEHEPHTHRWDFISYILHGTMINEIMEEVDANEDEKTFLKCKAHGTTIGSTREYDVISKNALDLKKKREYNKGDMYTMKGSEIHVAKIPECTFTSTLFLTSPSKYETSNVYMPNLTLPPTETCLSPMNIDKLKKAIKGIIEIL